MAEAVANSLRFLLMKFIDQLSIPIPEPQVASLFAEAKFLLRLLHEKNRDPNVDLDLVKNMEKQMIEAIYEAQDVVEYHVLPHLLPSEYGTPSGEEVIVEKLRKVVRKLKSIKDTEAGNVDHRRREETSQPLVLSRFLKEKNKFVGRKALLMKLKNQLINESSSELKLVAVTGMIGIGKTALVNEIYNDPLVGSTFDYQDWVSVDPRNGMREVLLSLVKLDSNRKLSTEELGTRLNKILSGKRYLIVMDNMREDAWDGLRTFLPDENNQSRIIVTTRHLDFTARATELKYIHQVLFLTEDESWELLRYTAYTAIGDEASCPPQLVKIGKAIAKSCQGLPLKIITLGSLLSRISPDPDTWDKLANDRELQNQEMLKVTQDLYNEHLPQSIKVCFLYMVAFPQYQHISVSKLYKLWIAEGFIEPEENNTQHAARKCLKYLFLKNLIVYHTFSSKLWLKTCSIHSAIWPFYERAAAEYKILKSIERCNDSADPSHRRFSIHKNVLFAIKHVYNSVASVSNTGSLLCTGPYHQYPLLRVNFLSFRLLKVLDAHSIRFYKFPVEIVKLVLLRFLALTLGIGELPASVSNLAQLQFLIVRRHSRITSSKSPCFLPIEIWNMKELKHLQVMGSDLPTPPCYDENAMLPNLLTLSDVSTLSCIKKVFRRIPNLTRLGVVVELPWDAASAEATHFHVFDQLVHLQKLETFKYIVLHPVLAPVLPDSRLVLPSQLKKITLSGCGFSWENMKDIARLPNLDVLKLRMNAFRGPQWETNETEFFNLCFLVLEDLDIEQWKATNLFLNLTHLVIHHCYKLREIPSVYQKAADDSVDNMIKALTLPSHEHMQGN